MGLLLLWRAAPTGNRTVSPAPVVVTFGVPVPAVTAGRLVSPAPVVVTFGVPVPAVTAGRLVSPAPVVITWAVPVPAVAAGRLVSPAPVAATWSIPVPSVTTGTLVSPAPVVITWAVPVPTVTAAAVGGTVDPYYRRQLRKPPRVVAESLHQSLLGRYGISEGKRIYGLMRVERKGPFQPGAKYDPDKKKPRT